jgi:hypothetical protein
MSTRAFGGFGLQAALSLMLAGASPGLAAGDSLLQAHTWENRLLLVFTPTPQHPEYLVQQRILAAVRPGLAERDLLVIHLRPQARAMIDKRHDAGFAALDLYREHDVATSAFAVILVGKDGTRKLVSDQAVDAPTLFALIDSMPMRQREMRERRT